MRTGPRIALLGPYSARRDLRSAVGPSTAVRAFRATQEPEARTARYAPREKTRRLDLAQPANRAPAAGRARGGADTGA